MEFNKEDENYVYQIISKNIKKYRKQKGLTQAELADRINYSLSFISSIESRKYQSFSLGVLWRISLVLGVDLYKLCIDDTINYKNQESIKAVKYICNKCNYETEIPFEIVGLFKKANEISTQIENQTPIFKCAKCDGFIIPKEQ